MENRSFEQYIKWLISERSWQEQFEYEAQDETSVFVIRPKGSKGTEVLRLNFEDWDDLKLFPYFIERTLEQYIQTRLDEGLSPPMAAGS